MEIIHDYPDWTCKDLLQARLLSKRNLWMLLTAVLLQPVLYPLVFWALSHSISLAFVGFMLGCLMLGIWMSFESGLIRKCRTANNVLLHKALRASRIFWTFIAPVLPLLALPGVLFAEMLAGI